MLNDPYPPGTYVWAKLRGYRWWPAQIQNEDNLPLDVLHSKPVRGVTHYAVYFFGSEDYAFIPIENLCSFIENYIIHSSGKNQKLFSIALKQAPDVVDNKLVERSEPSLPKTRGRKPKAKAQPKSKVSVTKEEIELLRESGLIDLPDDDLSDEFVPLPEKKRRGRPSAASKEKIKKVAAKILESEEESLKASESDAIPAKKPRGRPKKSIQVRSKPLSARMSIKSKPKRQRSLEISEFKELNLEPSPLSNKAKREDLMALSNGVNNKSKDDNKGKRKRESKQKVVEKAVSYSSATTESASNHSTPIRNETPVILEKDDEIRSTSKPKVDKVSKLTIVEIETKNDIELCKVDPIITEPEVNESGLNTDEQKIKVPSSMTVEIESHKTMSVITELDTDIPISILADTELSKVEPIITEPEFNNPQPMTDISELERFKYNLTENESEIQVSQGEVESKPVKKPVVKISKLNQNNNNTADDIILLRHQIQKYVLKEKMQFPNKAYDSISQLEEFPVTSDIIKESKIIKVLRHIIRMDLGSAHEEMIARCKKLHKKYRTLEDGNTDNVEHSP